VATFTTSFLGCKVSQTDARALRERLLADGHTEAAAGADVAIVNTCCVTHEAVAKSRKAAARAARAHGRVYVTGCGANLHSSGAGGDRRRGPAGCRHACVPAPATARSAVRQTQGSTGCAPRQDPDGCSFRAFCGSRSSGRRARGVRRRLEDIVGASRRVTARSSSPA
jgi:hypothetical protein